MGADESRDSLLQQEQLRRHSRVEMPCLLQLLLSETEEMICAVIDQTGLNSCACRHLNCEDTTLVLSTNAKIYSKFAERDNIKNWLCDHLVWAHC